MNELLLAGISQVVTPFGVGPKRGAAMRQLRIVPEAAVAVDAGVISWIGPEREWSGSAESVIDLGRRAVVPGLVDPHTHAVWAGDRLADFEARSTGATYEEILAAGGGIWHTIRETTEKSSEEMATLALPRIEALQRSGATTIEVKSGYGYTLEAEMRMLEAIRLLQGRTQSRLVPTLLIHICPERPTERQAYREMVCNELIPEVARRRLASAVDIFVEHHAWSSEDARIVLACAQAAGLRIKLHTEQFQQVGGLELGVEMGALSVDHLEVCSLEQCELVARSKTIATILPGVSLHLGLAAAPGRKLIDAGAAVAIGTDLNPGSSPLFSTAAAMGLAVRLNGLTAPEALTACTVNAAAALGLASVGRLEVGMQADLLVLESADWRDLSYTLGQNMVCEVWVAGRKQAA
ncbi:imidazolonepropionase [Tunturibacter empetritectus]|uniref:Imidazolonepropionase n=1 Tax=Tunturiibacter lichenicola TaxID=2051959 RepID=A0A7W8N386_9BACT|nr:imidazolonepropionase [Edaphobacter lichenicola]MBB5343864.1 imidazolonepropionase [Edaphobacter lichenicola]